ncbi:pilus assembly protein TadG-related protein [Occultella kanbiaonis]|uniref:pilus assembly protein TadG-related protein n=1 Tax=Occultella kanbiaonis TaxID=2675754 RepID=UPI003F49130E
MTSMGARLRERREDGQILLLSLVYGLVTLALVMVVASVASVYLERKRLLSLADALAADAADSVDEAQFYTGDRGSVVDLPLSDESVRSAVEEYLRAAPAGVTDEFEALAVIDPTGSPDGDIAEVSLGAVSRPPLVPWVLIPWSDGIVIEVTAHAEAG